MSLSQKMSVRTLFLGLLFLGLASANNALAAIGGNAMPDSVFWYSSNTNSYTDETGDVSEASANDVPVGFVTANDVLYIGSQSPFDTVYFKMGTWGTSSIIKPGLVKYEYSDSRDLVGNAQFAPVTVTASTNDIHFKTQDPSGIVSIQFTPPSNWVKAKKNGVNAYWLAIQTISPYATSAVASAIDVRAYNLKVSIQNEFGGPFLPPSGGSFNTSAVALSSCDQAPLPAANLYGILDHGNGVYSFALPTDGRSCTLQFKPSLNIEPKISVQGLSTTSQDLSGTPYIRNENTKFIINDERGSQVTEATVLWGGMTQILSGPANTYYTSSPVNKNYTIAKTGYVTETGTSGNTGLNNVAVDPTVASTIVSLTGAVNQPCTTIPAGVTTICAALRLNTQMTVTQSGGGVLPGATVTFTYAANGALADDQSLSTTDDATGLTDANGIYKAALPGMNYGYSVSAPGYQTVTGSILVTEGAFNPITVSLSPSGVPVDQTISTSQSSVSVSPSIVSADNLQTSTLTVIARNSSGVALSGKSVTISANGSATITPSQATTNGSGVATFTVKSSQVGTVTLTATIDGQALSTKPAVQFTTPGLCPFTVGTLVKLADDGNAQTQSDSAVYYYGIDCKRHAFSNDKVYFSWYANFNSVSIISASSLASMPLGKNVTYRPGVKMVKFATLNNVYAVSKGGKLRWITSEAVATGLYGATWNKQIDDIADTFFTDYIFGTDIVSSGDYSVSNELAGATTIDSNW